MGKSNSGKNTLMYSLLNETILGKGEMSINGDISLITSKFPSIVPGTLRDNILLGSKFYGKMYNEVINLIKLDLTQFPGGDLVEVLAPPQSNLTSIQLRQLMLCRIFYKCYIETDNLFNKSYHIFLIDKLFNDFSKDDKIYYIECIKEKLLQEREATIMLVTHDPVILNRSN
jgi:hypothetical protein